MRSRVRLSAIVLFLAPALTAADQQPPVERAAPPITPLEAHTPPPASPDSPRAGATPQIELPPLPDGVSELRLADVFRFPVGDRGLELTQTALSLDGRTVRLLGFMVNRCSHVPGQLLLAPIPITLHDHEMGPCDDLPASTVFVDVPTHAGRIVPYTPGLLLLTGTLRLDRREHPDGRVSWLNLELDSPADAEPPPAPSAGVDDAKRRRRGVVAFVPPEAGRAEPAVEPCPVASQLFPDPPSTPVRPGPTTPAPQHEGEGK